MGRLLAVVFDVDGTLADTEEAHRQAFNTAFAAHGLGWVWDADLYAELLRVTGGKERIAHHLGTLGLSAGERARLARMIPRIHATKTAAFAERVERGELPPRAGIPRLLREARAAGIRLAIASTTTAANVDALLAASFDSQVPGFFDFIATGDIVANKKPAPDIYHAALAALGVRSQDALAIEDSEIGLRAASAAGLVTIATPTRWTAGQDFTAAALVLPSLEEMGIERLASIHADALRRAVTHAIAH